jgi:hypothetical protein
VSSLPDPDPYEVVGEAVLLDYPLRLWDRQQDHTRELLREFTLMLAGVRSGTTHSPPQRLVDLARSFGASFGPLMESLNNARQAELDAGRDRMDWRLPLMRSMPAILEQVDDVLLAVDEYCASGEMLALSRSAQQVRFQTWVSGQIRDQMAGAEPAPWPGPFD